ncbi:MAG: PEP-CTERM sorting domain-containing protein, partial [Myxococcota bacterium]|nr:PEP-CTERM sorting domain-containing protein [Myxococcota bacterium]
GTWSAGTLEGDGTTTVTGAFGITSTATKTLSGGHTVVAQGETTWDNGDVLLQEVGTTFRNEGTFTAAGDAADIINSTIAGSEFLNQGTFRKAGVNDVTRILAAFENQGLVTVETGTLDLDGSYLQTGADAVTRLAGGDITGFIPTDAAIDAQGGRIEGNGSIEADIALDAALAPGLADEVGQIDVTGDIEMGDDGVLDILLEGFGAGTGFDFVSVVGEVMLDGDLLLELDSAFAALLTPGDEFTILQSDRAVLGAFDNVASQGRLGSFDVFYGEVVDGTDYIDRVVVSFVPEPGTGALLGFALILLAQRRRARR